jgi:hypothetical protein
MPFRANFVSVREGTDTLRIEGETNDDLLAAAERMYVGVGPEGAKKLKVYEVPLLTDWSVLHDPGDVDPRQPLVCAGVVILREGGPPFMWTQVLRAVSPIRARPKSVPR